MKAPFRRVSAFLLAVLLLSTYAVRVDALEEERGCGETGVKRIALTFDDGPHPRSTDAILDVLERYDITATFFVVGENAALYPRPLQRAASLGHEIGNHTYTHPKLKSTSAASLTEELTRTEALIEQLIGRRPALFRPPEGFRDGVVRTVSREQGYELVFWTVDTLDWTGASANAIEQTILKQARDGSIILCHDYIVGQGHTAEALERVLPRLLEEGYEFVTVSALLETAGT